MEVFLCKARIEVMSRPKRSTAYPAQFLDMVQALGDEPTLKIPVPFDTVNAAKSFRLDWNSFKAAAQKDGLNALYPQLPALFVTIEGTNAMVMHRDYSPLALKIEKALDKVRKA